MDGCWLTVQDDPDPAYYQAEKTTQLAQQAMRAGHRWVIPVDTDEFWYPTDGRRLADFLAGLAPDVAYVNAPLYNHLPTSTDPPASCEMCHDGAHVFAWEAEPILDPPGEASVEAVSVPVPCPQCGSRVEPNPFKRIGWRQREHGALPKVAARLRPGLEIRQGNHSAWAPGHGLTSTGLVVRHYSWRAPQQYVKKLENGYRAYAATRLPDDVGAHWRMFGPPEEETFADRVTAHFYEWFHVNNPELHPELIYDPAPWPGVPSEQVGSRGRVGVGSPPTTEGDQMEEHDELVQEEGVPEPIEGQEELATDGEQTEDDPTGEAGGTSGNEDAPDGPVDSPAPVEDASDEHGEPEEPEE